MLYKEETLMYSIAVQLPDLERPEEPGGGAAGGDERVPVGPGHGQLGGHHAVGADVAQGVHVRLA